MDPILGRRSIEPALAQPVASSPWSQAAGPVPDEPGSFRVVEELELPPGTVHALGVPRDRPPAPTDAPPRRRVATVAEAGPVADPIDEPAEADHLAEVDAWLDRAEATLATVKTYRVRMTRQERVGEDLLPEETVLLSLRRAPLAVRLEWPEGPNQGREVLFSEQECGGQMHVRLKPSVPVPPLKMAPDSPLALQNSRHPINEAGVDPVLTNLRSQVEALRAGEASPGSMTLERDEAGAPVLRRVDPAGADWTVTLDPETALPTVVRQVDPDGNLVESYRFVDYEFDPADLASSEAFDPAKRWAGAGGFLGRLARAAQGTAPETPATESPAP